MPRSYHRKSVGKDKGTVTTRLKKLFTFRPCQAVIFTLLVLIVYLAYHPKKTPFIPFEQLNSSQYHYINMKDHKGTEFIRIVHISDTHGFHKDLLETQYIPQGDILIHSGDFSQYYESKHQDLVAFMHPLEEFFRLLPHKHKVYLPGNHDYSLQNHSTSRVQELLPSATFLHDRSLVIQGIKFYGTGWNRARQLSKAQAFALPEEKLRLYWNNIPTETDILVSHSPPYAIMDQDVQGNLPAVMECVPEKPCNHEHMGSKTLHEAVTARIRPRLHLFGHSHFGNGWVKHDGIVFCNSALETHRKLTVIDFYYT